MSIKNTFNIFCADKDWKEKVFSADLIWQQLKDLLAKEGQSLTATPRRPDVRMICNNLTGQELRFKNPGDHSGSKEEVIPATGDRAVMMMIKGDSLAAQYKNAAYLYDTYGLGEKGLTQQFINDMSKGLLTAYLDEAYGPAPFEAQTSKLVPVLWPLAEGAVQDITPVKGLAAAYGARAATEETVFIAQFPVHVYGTGTTAELVESEGMAIAVSSDWKTQAEKTRPIVASVAKVYYGSHFADIPVVKIDMDGKIYQVSFAQKTQAALNTKPPAPKP